MFGIVSWVSGVSVNQLGMWSRGLGWLFFDLIFMTVIAHDWMCQSRDALPVMALC